MSGLLKHSPEYLEERETTIDLQQGWEPVEDRARPIGAHSIRQDDWPVGQLKVLAEVFQIEAASALQIVPLEPLLPDRCGSAEPGLVEDVRVEPLDLQGGTRGL